MNKTLILVFLLFIFLLPSCSNVYKRHYDHGYTILKNKKRHHKEIVHHKDNIQENTINVIGEKIIDEKKVAEIDAQKSFQTLHKTLNQPEAKIKSKLWTSLNKIQLAKNYTLSADTVYRKEPPKNSQVKSNTTEKVQIALVLSIISICTVWLIWPFALIPAIIALSMIKKASATAKLNGEILSYEAEITKVLAWITIGLNILLLLLVMLYISILLLALATI